MTTDIHRMNHCGTDQDPVICIACAHDAALEEDARREAARNITA